MDFGMFQIQTCDSGYSDCIFKEADALLNDSDAWHALQFVANKKNMDRYHSVMDFLFCELMGGVWVGRCMAFYRGNGKRLLELMTPEEILCCDKLLCVAIWYAQDCLKKHRQETWTKFRFKVLKLVA